MANYFRSFQYILCNIHSTDRYQPYNKYITCIGGLYADYAVHSIEFLDLCNNIRDEFLKGENEEYIPNDVLER